MKQTVGMLDRNVRIVLGALLVIVGAAGYAGLLGLAWIGIGQAMASVVLVLIGAVLLVTGLTRVCAIYSLLGIDTLGRGPEPEAAEEAEPPAERTA